MTHHTLHIHAELEIPDVPWISRQLLKIPPAFLDRAQPWIIGVALGTSVMHAINSVWLHWAMPASIAGSGLCYALLGLWAACQHTRQWAMGQQLLAQGDALQKMIHNNTANYIASAVHSALNGEPLAAPPKPH